MNREFILEHDGTSKVINPYDIQGIKKDRVKDNFYFKTSVKGNVVLTKDDAQFLIDIDNSLNRCLPVTLIINETFNHATTEIFKGEFGMIDCDFNIRECEVTINSIKEVSVYTCLETNKELDVNALDGTAINDVILSPIEFNIEFFDLPDILSFEALTPAEIDEKVDEMVQTLVDSGQVHPNYAPYINVDFVGSTGGTYYTCIASAIILRLELPDGACPTLIEGFNFVEHVDGECIYAAPSNFISSPMYIHPLQDCADPPPAPSGDPTAGGTVMLALQNPLGAGGVPTNQCVYAEPKISLTLNDITYSRARTFEDVVLKVASESCPTITSIKSDFFQINPENVSSDNYITGDTNKLNNMYFIHLSDVLDPDATEPATKGWFKFFDLMEYLKTLFNIRWVVDNGVLVLEHYSFFRGSFSGSFNVTGDILLEQFNGNALNYSYDKEKLPYIESFEMPHYSFEDFEPSQIIYNDSSGDKIICVTDEKKEYTFGTISTDMNYLKYQPALSDRSGWVLVACNSSDRIIDEVGVLSGDNVANGHLSIANLLDNYHKSGRPHAEGWMNGAHETFTSIIRSKKGEQLYVPCYPQYQEVKVDTLIKSPIGDGIVESIEYQFNEPNQLTIETIY